ncbi:heterokaryon incompatibility protein-domain-containing protein [Phaeosphaeria sp. MPI-PUGE-AT-0046c]|nr:heterokaryon incompatibility protein-domain-containing protein [Phaeosphaeria sp. MPI-PUGE-AT-0046c]
MPDDDKPLPSRVLAVRGDNTRPWIQLIEGKGLKGRYLALSHCWGSAEKPPLRTTSENYQKHQSGILFEDLPKTFQDTLKLAQGIGNTYVWIDSLCIIQGDRQDWHSEAANMRDIYRNPALVVAASGAKDSSEGLLIDERPPATVLRLPYRIAGEYRKTFNMTQSPNPFDSRPADGPFEKRAWTLQERYLALRLTTFMPNCISWLWDSEQVTGTGEYLFVLSQEIHWSDLLTVYTAKSLTFPPDRVEALRGVANLYPRGPTDPTDKWDYSITQPRPQFSRDGYVAEYGVWREHLVFQLLWFHHGPCYDDGRLATMPSWSWAATDSIKGWPKERIIPKGCDNIRNAEEMPKALVITSAVHLKIVGHSSTIKLVPFCVQHNFDTHDLKLVSLLRLYDPWVEYD